MNNFLAFLGYLYFLIGVPNKDYGKDQNFHSILSFPTSLIFIKNKLVNINPSNYVKIVINGKQMTKHMSK